MGLPYESGTARVARPAPRRLARSLFAAIVAVSLRCGGDAGPTSAGASSIVPVSGDGQRGPVGRVAAPASPSLAPPGHYLLFILNRNGVPSKGITIRIR